MTPATIGLKKYSYLLVILIFCLAACQTATGIRRSQTAKTGSMADSSSAPCPVYQTGQRATYAPNDDGAQQSGMPWPAPRFVDNGNQTVSDRLTGLMWTKNAKYAAGKIDWEAALAAGTACDSGGYADWRLPNRNELASLIDLGRARPALPKDHPFENVQSDYYWTATTLSDNDDQAWVIHFFVGFITGDDKGGTHHAWFVRNGR